MKSRRTRAFTLVEILAVVVLIGLLAVFIVPQILQRVGPARHSIARAQIANIEQILSVFHQDVGRYPTKSEGLQALIEQPAGVSNWKGPYCRQQHLIDPWGNPYIYNHPGPQGRPYEIISYGADGAPGGEGVNADISSAQ